MKNYTWSSLMIGFNKTINECIIDFARKNIPAECENDPEKGSGIVTEPHISILTDIELTYPMTDLRNVIGSIPAFDINFGPISFFKNDNVDVIKIEIESDQLNEIHYYLRSVIPNGYKFDEYKPHCTLGFVKPDSCNGILNQCNYFRGMKFPVEWINYNSAKGIPFSIKIDRKMP